MKKIRCLKPGQTNRVQVLAQTALAYRHSYFLATLNVLVAKFERVFLLVTTTVTL